MEYADNGIIIRNELDNSAEVYEVQSQFYASTEQYKETIAKAYGGLLADHIEIENQELQKSEYFGFTISIEITPITNEKDLFFKTK